MDKLQQKIYSMSNSFLPLDKFYNDIRDNQQAHYNKDVAFNDLDKIADFIINLQQEYEILEKALELALRQLYPTPFYRYDESYKKAYIDKVNENEKSKKEV